MVRICLADGSTGDDQHKSTFGLDHAGNMVRFPTVLDFSQVYLERVLTQHIRFEMNKDKGFMEAVYTPSPVSRQILDMAGEWRLPEFRGIATVPFLTHDGRVVKDNGIDLLTNVYVHIPYHLRSLTIKDNPTRDDAIAAVKTLLDLLYEFPFKDDASRSVALSAIIVVIFRTGFPGHPMPMHIFDSPTPGTGKSHLLNTVSQVATGQNCPMIAMSNDVREFEKKLVGAILSGRPIIGIDNVQAMVTTDLMCHVTEQPLMDIRPLGTSRTVQVVNSATIFANGNNMMIANDLIRRAVKCTLDRNMQNPEDYGFESDPLLKVQADRGKYIAAILTIVIAYIVAGMPGRLEKASFSTWSHYVRSALVWLGQADPEETVAELRAADPVKTLLANIFTAWVAFLGIDKGYTVKEIMEKVKENGNRKADELYYALMEVASNKVQTDILDAKRLGNYIKGKKKCSSERSQIDRGLRSKRRCAEMDSYMYWNA